MPNVAAAEWVPSFAAPPAPPASLPTSPPSVPSSPKIRATAKEFTPCSPVATKVAPPPVPSIQRIRKDCSDAPLLKIEDLLKLEQTCGALADEAKRKLGVFGGFRYVTAGAGGGSSGAGFGSRDFAQARSNTAKLGFPSRGASSSDRDMGQARRGSNRSGDRLRERSPPRQKKQPPKAYVKPDWAKKGDDDDEATLAKKANSILNKLTLEKFDRLSTDFCALEFNTVERVAGAVDLVVTKAHTQPHFVAVFAMLCVKLSETPLVPGEEEGAKKFRRLLLERCQAEFEKDHTQTIKELEEMDAAGKAKKMATIRKQYIGHMLFIAALYKQGLLKENIMHHCIQELFGDPAEPDGEKLECLAKLMTTIGKKLDAAALDKKESAKFMKAYFKQLKKLEVNKTLDARLRFALKDLRELRDNTWVPRRKVEEAKTISEIHADIQDEEDKKAGRRPKSRVKREKEENLVSADGWETVATTAASVRRASQKSERAKSPATVAKADYGGGFGALLGGDKKNKKEKKEKKKKSKSKDSLSDLNEASSFDESKYRGKCKASVVEYFSIEQVDEVVACAREELAQLGEPSRLSLLAGAALEVTLDGKQKDRDRVPQLLLAQAAKDVLAPAHFASAFLDALVILPDITIDAPKAPQWLGDVLKALVAADACSLAFLETAPAALTEMGEEGTKCWADFKAYVAWGRRA